ncbi:unnamed protein product [Larinioides sclopetarius]|uniref:Uncharacterized protein n=1 Tax=Larinioides sclopetarius TaxID=280406 RepID=A0AAV1YU52_9ARAC
MYSSVSALQLHGATRNPEEHRDWLPWKRAGPSAVEWGGPSQIHLVFYLRYTGFGIKTKVVVLFHLRREVNLQMGS